MAHPNKHIREAIEYALEQGWNYEEGGKSHRKGTLLCPYGHGGCMFFVYGTPRIPENTAKRIRRDVDNCPGAEL
jgi:hypothetical protein